MWARFIPSSFFRRQQHLHHSTDEERNDEDIHATLTEDGAFTFELQSTVAIDRESPPKSHADQSFDFIAWSMDGHFSAVFLAMFLKSAPNISRTKNRWNFEATIRMLSISKPWLETLSTQCWWCLEILISLVLFSWKRWSIRLFNIKY